MRAPPGLVARIAMVAVVALGALGTLGTLGALAGCAELGALDEGRTVSWGACNGGTILQPITLPEAGDGYWVPPLWRERRHEYGTDELVDLVVGVARRIAAPGAPRLGVADMSPPAGGSSVEHHSHQAGRDVDLLYFLTTPDGDAIENDAMRHVGADGLTVVDRASPDAPRLRFDIARNWQLVRALLIAPEAEVQYIFLYEPLSQRLLEHAHDRGEPDALIARARAVLHQPGDSARHDDHMHVRIYCSPTDHASGCIDRGPPRGDEPRSPDDAAAIATNALGRVPLALLAGR